MPPAEGLATRSVSESCVGNRKGACEALTGECVGLVLSHEISITRGADAVESGGRQHPGCRKREAVRGPARSVDPTHAHKILYARTGRSRVLPHADGASGTLREVQGRVPTR
jgi:hypothetical protein